MIKVYCDNCGEDITGKINAKPYKLLMYKSHFCNRKCCIDHQVRTGHFKKMSDNGSAGRQRVIPQSNREKPRRRKKVM